MEFNKAYNRQEFMNFLQNSFLPDDFVPTEEHVSFSTQMKYSSKAVKLGSSPTLDLVVYEIKHTSKHDARVALSKEAFRMLADEMEDRALVVFVPEDNHDNYRFSFIEISLDLAEDSSHVTRNYSNPRRYSYLLGKDIAYYTPNKYLNEKGRVVNDEDLHSRFSVEVLTKEFYQELQDWYAWAIKIIRFPNDINDDTDDAKYNNEGAIRLITRLIFVWFLKQRHLIPDEFFDEGYIANNLIAEFNPHKIEGLFSQKSFESKYYKAILQNLFFAMLNSPITAEGSTELSERHFRNGRGDYDNNKLMRYEDCFSNPQLFVHLANHTVPFLNGGLFDCLDDKDNGMYYDGFSDRESVKGKLVVPDFLFFGDEVGKNIDLSEWYGDKKKKKVSARGIIDILKRYNFTVEENTPFDKEVSLDPELLGKVFENLLASFNPETQTTARKQTGSFYTPREIVQYMVNESLVAHLKRTVGKELEPKFRQLLQYSDEPVELTDEQRMQIMQSLYNCKILDPACGSGAFPMGMLQQMVHILGRIDSDNKQWKEIMMNQAIGETTEAYRSASQEERSEQIADIERSFDEGVNRPDYARKLYLIENCIYGVDIQPIAIQISKLRFFISLVVDQKTNSNPADNFGIRPLPNLEAKFVAANTLIGLNKKDTSLFDSDAIKAKENELKAVKHKIFGAKTVRTKRKWRERVNELRQEIADMLKDCGAVGNAEAQELAGWDMFNQNASSPFFDPEWMFGVKDGFDIVIGNPPYVQVKKGIVDKKDYPYSEGNDTGKQNLYKLFVELSYNKLTFNGISCLIVQSSLMGDVSATFTRKLLLKKCQLCFIVEFPKTIKNKGEERAFSGVLQGTCIVLFRKNPSSGNPLKISIGNSRQSIMNPSFGYIYPQSIYFFSPQHEIPLIAENALGLYEKIKKDAVTLDNIQDGSAQGNINTIYLNEIKAEINTGAYIAKGAHIHRYYIDKLLYNCLENSISEPIFQKNFHKHIVLTQNITGTTDTHRIHATLCECRNTKIVFLHSVNITYLPSLEAAKYVVALLNSKLLDWVFRVTSTNNHVNIYELNNLPIKMNLDNHDIISKVNDILRVKQLDSSENTLAEENEIDRLVYKLYDLTYDEVKIVDPETPITEEAYEKI